MLKPHRIMSAGLLLILATGILGSSAGRPACSADNPPEPKGISVPPLRFTGTPDAPSPNSKPLPEKLSKGQKYIVSWHSPLVIDYPPSVDGGSVKINERKGPRPYAVANTITAYPADPDNDDIVTVPDPFIYEITVENSGNVYLEMFPSLKQDKDGKAVPLTKADIVRRPILVDAGTGPRPPPVVVPPVVTDPLAAKLQAAFDTEGGDKKANAAKLAAIYRNAEMATIGDLNVKTVGELFTITHNAANSIVPLPILGGVREYIAAELRTKLPTVPSTPLTPEIRVKASQQYARMADLLGGLK